jgi:hypothetical protein
LVLYTLFLSLLSTQQAKIFNFTAFMSIRNYIKFLVPTVSLCLGAFLISCNEIPNCGTGSDNLLRVKFISITFDTENDVFVLSDTSLAVLEVRSEARPDSLIYAIPDTTALLDLPVNPFSDTTGFLINIAGTEYTLRAGYNRQVRLIAPECGIEQLYEDLEVSGNLPGDSVQILNDRLLKPAGQNQNINVEIYF